MRFITRINLQCQPFSTFELLGTATCHRVSKDSRVTEMGGGKGTTMHGGGTKSWYFGGTGTY